MRRIAFNSLLLFGVASAGLGQSDRKPYAPLHVDIPSEIQTAEPMGRMDPSEDISISVSLPYRDPAGIQNFVEAVSNPKSPLYRKFLTPAEIGRRFGPSDQSIEKVKSFLTASGMKVKLVGDNRLSILTHSTVGQVEAAFKTEILEFAPTRELSAVGGHLYSLVSEPSVPLELKPLILDISGLENFTRPKPLNANTPTDIRNLYNITPLFSNGMQGQGRTIAISSWDGYRLANVPHEYSQFGLPTPSGGVGSNISVVTIDGGSGNGNEQGEADLDIQSILGVAPLCNLIIYDGSGGDLISVLTKEANDNKADIISESYGWSIGSSTALAAHNLHLSMSAEGITYMAASGDSGTTLNYYYPNIEPEVLMVGGTTANVDILGNRSSEKGWSGSGGGWKATADPFNTLPSYQLGTGVPTNIPYRLIPDVALNADPGSGYVVYLDNNFYVIGGTSGASPTCAGSLGVSEQQLITNGALAANGTGNYRLGRVQDVLYSYNGDPSVFFDITSGGNGVLPNGTNSVASAGWDFVTGWGSINFSGLVTKLSGTGLSQLSVAPASVEGGTLATGTLTLANAAPNGGTQISLSGGDSSVSYPSTVTVPAGSRSATFSVTTTAVSSADTENLSATDGKNTKTATLVVTPSPISSLSVTPTSAASGSSFSGTITLLHAAASPSGDVVSLSGGDSLISYPATVKVAAGSTTATFTVNSAMTPTNVSETITATLGSSTKSATIALTAMGISSFTVSPTSIQGGSSATGTITLVNPAGSSGATISLSGGDSSVSYPASVTIPANGKSATVQIATSVVNSADPETLTASFGSSTAKATLTINPPTISSFVFTPSSVFGSVSSQGTIRLSGVAGKSGLSIALSGGDSSVSYPASVTVPAGAATISFTVSTSVVASLDTENIVATLSSATVSATLTVKPAGVVSTLTFSPSSLVGSTSSTGIIQLTGPSGPIGVTVSLTGGDANVSFPSSVTIPAGASSGSFTISTKPVSSNDIETLTASIGPSSAKGSLTILATTVKTLTFNPASVYGSQASTGTITLNGPAASGGYTVNLAGGDTSVSYPATVSVAAGTTAATFSASTLVVPTTDNEIIRASLNGSTVSATLTIKPAGVVSTLSFLPTSVVGATNCTGIVQLTGPSGPSGVTVKLSGGDANISFPTSLNIPAGASSASFAVTTIPVAANVVESLTATIGPSSANGSFTIVATAVKTLAFSPTSVYGSQSSSGTITLNGPAGSGGCTVNLSGGDASVSFPATVTIPAGATTANFTASTSIVSTTDNESIRASLSVASAVASATLTIKPAGIVSSLSFSPTSIIGGTNGTGTIKLTGPSGPVGVTVTLSGGDANVSYPATVSIPAGASSANFIVKTNAVVSNEVETLAATIGPSTSYGAFTITSPVLATFTISPTSIKGGTTANGVVTISGGAPSSGITITIGGGDTTTSYPATLSIPAGSSSASFTITTSSVTAATSKTFSVKLGAGSLSASLKLTP